MYIEILFNCQTRMNKSISLRSFKRYCFCLNQQYSEFIARPPKLSIYTQVETKIYNRLTTNDPKKFEMHIIIQTNDLNNCKVLKLKNVAK